MILLHPEGGGSVSQSRLIHGLVLPNSLAHPDMPTQLCHVKVAVFSCALEECSQPPRQADLGTLTSTRCRCPSLSLLVFSVHYLMNLKRSRTSYIIVRAWPFDGRARVGPAPKTRFLDQALPEHVLPANAEHSLAMRKMAEELEALGVGLIICQWGIDPALAQLLAQRGVQVVKWVSAAHVEQSAMITGATICWRFSDLAANMLGDAVQSTIIYLGRDAAESNVSPMLVLDGTGVPFVTLLACASSQAACQEVGRTIGDAIGVIRSLSTGGPLVVGAGAFEMELHVRLASLERNSDKADEFAFRAWAKALVHLPVCIAQAASLDAGQLVGSLKDAHLKGDRHAGLDVEHGEVVDSLHRGIVEPLISKQRWMSMATDLAVLLLSIGSIESVGIKLQS